MTVSDGGETPPWWMPTDPLSLAASAGSTEGCTLAPSVSLAKPEVISVSPALSPLVTTASLSSCWPIMTWTILALTSTTVNTNGPFGPRCSAATGMTTASFSTCTLRRTLVKMPGQSCSSLFSKSALSFTVPVVASMVLFTTASTPWSTMSRPLASSAWTSSWFSSEALLMRGSSCCGTLKMTLIGWICDTVTMPVVSAAWSRFPTSTLRMPVRPAIGEVMSV